MFHVLWGIPQVLQIKTTPHKPLKPSALAKPCLKTHRGRSWQLSPEEQSVASSLFRNFSPTTTTTNNNNNNKQSTIPLSFSGPAFLFCSLCFSFHQLVPSPFFATFSAQKETCVRTASHLYDFPRTLFSKSLRALPAFFGRQGVH